MDYQFSNGLKNLQPSVIREILKYASGTSVISLAAGNPSPEAFPIEKVKQISNGLFEDNPIDVLQYSITEGYAPLRTYMKERMRSKYNVGNDNDDIIITAGAQQVMSLLTKSVANPGDVVICDEPAFIGALNMFRSLGMKLCGVPLQEDGMNLNSLEEALKNNPNAKFIYTIPNFQNPTGLTSSFEKRKGIYELAKKYNVLILEDNPYGDLRFAGNDVPSIKTLDEDGIVVYAGSFSKVLAPGLRVGYAIAPKPVIQKMTVAKQGEDVHTNIWAQMICYEFIQEDFDKHIDMLRGLYKKKATIMMEQIEKYLVPYGIKYYPVEGGLFIWCELPSHVNMLEFCSRAVQEKQVAVVPGNAFITDENAECHSIRLNFSTPTDENLIEGVKRLGELAEEMF